MAHHAGRSWNMVSVRHTDRKKNQHWKRCVVIGSQNTFRGFHVDLPSHDEPYTDGNPILTYYYMYH